MIYEKYINKALIYNKNSHFSCNFFFLQYFVILMTELLK